MKSSQAGEVEGVMLYKVKVEETDNNSVEFYGEGFE